MTTKDTRIHEGGANVFADLGLPDTQGPDRRGAVSPHQRTQAHAATGRDADGYFAARLSPPKCETKARGVPR